MIGQLIDVASLLVLVFGPAALALLMPTPRFHPRPRPRRSRGRHRALAAPTAGGLAA